MSIAPISRYVRVCRKTGDTVCSQFAFLNIATNQYPYSTPMFHHLIIDIPNTVSIENYRKYCATQVLLLNLGK